MKDKFTFAYELIIVLLIFVVFAIGVPHFTTTNNNYFAYSHFPNITSDSKINTQQWIDTKDKMSIQFTYEPEKPIIDTFTELRFSIQNTETDEHIENFTARVIVTNGIRIFKFENITGQDGHFSVRYIFPDDGTHQVLARIDTEKTIVPASFDVFVPHQSPPSMLNPFPKPVDGQYTSEQIASMILAISIPAVAVISLIILVKRYSAKR